MTPFDEFDWGDDSFTMPEANVDSNEPARPVQPTNNNTTMEASERGNSEIQIDEEVVVKNKRKPQVKLIDRWSLIIYGAEGRLLSDRGLKRLRHDAPKHLKFKGKGHEKKDLQRLLGYYQLWMHDVFPKARFRDCIKMTEREGHKAQLREMRKQWIDESKLRDDLGDFDELEALESIEREQNAQLEGPQEQQMNPAPAEDEPLFVDDMSDFDMDEILRGSQELNDLTQDDGHVQSTRDKLTNMLHEEQDEFEDEMDALNEAEQFNITISP